MAFVNEYIPETDFERYGLQTLDESTSPPELPPVHVRSKDWTIDRERDVYLRKFSNSGKEVENSDLIGWTFYWKGELIWFARRVLDVGGARGGPQWGRSKILGLHIADHLKAKQDEILCDIADAFNAYAGGGVFSTATEYNEQIEFDLR